MFRMDIPIETEYLKTTVKSFGQIATGRGMKYVMGEALAVGLMDTSKLKE